jgi:hypothetical protein
MAPRQSRPTLHLRLAGQGGRDGEISLTDLAKVAEQTQRVVTRIARGMVDDHAFGRPRRNIVSATTLTLFGLRPGSTVLDIALPDTAADTLSAEDMPVELGEMALAVLAESLELLSESDPAPLLPVGVDSKVAADIGTWLRALRDYTRISIEAELNHGTIQAVFVPREAQVKLRKASSQPSVPYVSADNQALTGRLYALNLRTGTFRIEDDARHSIQLSVPEDLRDEAAQLVNTRVRAYGRAALDDRYRLVSFAVAALEQLPEYIDQAAFFERHELVVPPRVITGRDLRAGIIQDLSDDEIAAFMAALDSE